TSHALPEVSGTAFKQCAGRRTDESFQAPIPESLPSLRSTTGDSRAAPPRLRSHLESLVWRLADLLREPRLARDFRYCLRAMCRTANRRVLPGTHPGITTQSP